MNNLLIQICIGFEKACVNVQSWEQKVVAIFSDAWRFLIITGHFFIHLCVDMHLFVKTVKFFSSKHIKCNGHSKLIFVCVSRVFYLILRCNLH